MGFCLVCVVHDPSFSEVLLNFLFFALSSLLGRCFFPFCSYLMRQLIALFFVVSLSQSTLAFIDGVVTDSFCVFDPAHVLLGWSSAICLLDVV